jgi:hypothetical protein
MGKARQFNVRTGAYAVLHRHQKVEEEWARLSKCHDLLHQAQVAAAVNGRTGGRCYITGCTESIISYPHAVPMWEGGVNHHLNRAGVCEIHWESVHRQGAIGQQFRGRLQVWLQTWYQHRGIAPAHWLLMARGDDPIHLPPDIGGEITAGVG